MDKQFNGYPTGIKSFDSILKDGAMKDSLALLLSEVGAGGNHWIYTSMLGLARLKLEQNAKKGDVVLPDKICYISFTKPKETILSEISGIKLASTEDLEKFLIFMDLSDRYFSNSKVPRLWIHGSMAHSADVLPFTEDRNLSDALIDVLDKYAENSIVIIDSMNDLIRSLPRGRDEWTGLITLFKGIGRMAKNRHAKVFALLTSNVFEKSMEEDLADSVDSVLVFRWDTSNLSQPRSLMHVKKSNGILPVQSEGHMLTLETKISHERGFEVSYSKEILGK